MVTMLLWKGFTITQKPYDLKQLFNVQAATYCQAHILFVLF